MTTPLSAVSSVTFRLINAFDKAGLLEEYTYKKILSVLNRAKKARVDGEEWQLVRMNPSHMKILQELELVPKPEEPPKKKRGRPKGSKNRPRQEEEATQVTTTVKRKRGRPPGSKNKPKPAPPEDTK